MERLTRNLVAAFVAGFATHASAQANLTGQTVDNGFFRPSADPSLTHPQPQPQPQAQPPARPTEALTAEDRQADPRKLLQWTEQQADRSVADANQARAQTLMTAPTPINGAFTGKTDERDR
jgi:hypothetical protein